jgi:hypothetical protein
MATPSIMAYDSATSRAPGTARRGDRSVRWAIVTFLLMVVALLLNPELACRDEFNPAGLLATAPPILWAAVPFTRYKTPKEHVVALVAMAVALFWLTLTWLDNVQFLFW